MINQGVRAMGPNAMSSVAKILLKLSTKPKAFGDSSPMVTQASVIVNMDSITEDQGDDSIHQSSALRLRPLLTGLSPEEREKLKELLTLLELDILEFKEALRERGMSVKDFMAMLNQNGLVIPLSSPQYRDAFIQKLANLDLLPKDYKFAPTKSSGRQQERGLSGLSLFAMKPSFSQDHGTERTKLNEPAHHTRGHPRTPSLSYRPF